MITSGSIHYILQLLNISVHIRDICVFLAPVFSGLTAIATYLLTKELWNEGAGLFAACFISIGRFQNPLPSSAFHHFINKKLFRQDQIRLNSTLQFLHHNNLMIIIMKKHFIHMICNIFSILFQNQF